jgi:zinc protease
METVLIPVANKPIISFRLVFRTGSVDDPAGKEGLTTLTSDVMVEGGTRKLSASQILEALFPMAGELRVLNDKEFTVFIGRVHRDHLDRFLEIFTDVLLEPRFDPSEFERLRTNAVNHVKNYLRGEDDETLGKVALDSILFEGHPYAHHVGGTVQGLTAITLDDVKAHARKVFTQDRLVVGLAGAVDEALARRVKDRLAALPATGAPVPKLPPVPKRRGQAVILKKDTLSTAISMGHAYPLRRGHPDYFAVAFALSHLGQHRQSQGVLFNELREKRGMNYGDYAYAEHFHQEAWTSMPRTNVGRTVQDFTIWLRPVEPANAVFATRGSLHFLQELLDRPIPQERFDAARGFLSGLTRVWEQTDQRKLGYAIDDRFYGTESFHASFRQALASMTPEQVHQAVRRHLRPEDLSFAYVTKDAEGLRKLLAEQPPTPIAYPTPKPPEVMAVDQKFIGLPIPVKRDAIQVIDAQSFMER